MKPPRVTSLQRVFTAVEHGEADRIPFFLLFTSYGARELGLSIEEYFSRPENVVEAQVRLRARYRHDCLYAFFYASLELEAWGGKVLFSEDGPPIAEKALTRDSSEIKKLEPPRIKETPCLLKVLKTIEMLKAQVKDDAPIIGTVLSPFSLPVLQMGFDKYFDLMYDQPERFEHLMKLNESFCVEWANAQLDAGANIICYFDPVSSTTIINREMYLKTGFKIAGRTIARINGPAGVHMGSGNCLPIIADLARTGALVVGTSANEDLAELKAACRGKLTVLGNLNGIEMCRWTRDQAEAEVKDAIFKAAAGGGFILSDNHGEIPFQVPEAVLMAISDAVHKWGQYPINIERE